MLLEDLPPELLGRSFGNLTLQERCSTIPFLSRTFLHIHKAFPPTCEELDCGYLKSCHAGLLSAIANSVERLRMDVPQPAILTEVMAVPLTRLRRLEINFDGAMPRQGPLVSLFGLSQLCHVTKLSIQNWVVDETADVEGFTGLQLLKKLHLSNIGYTSRVSHIRAASGFFGERLWSTLAAMPTIEKADVLLRGNLNLILTNQVNGHDGILCAFCHSLSLATQLRSLRVGISGPDHIHMLQGQGVQLYNELQQLTRLTALKLHAFLAQRWDGMPFQEITTLMKLSMFHLPKDRLELVHAGASLRGTSLTCLKLHGGNFGYRQPGRYSLMNSLPAETPGLSYLRELHVVDMHLETVPAEVAAALQRLTALHLGPGNRLTRIPAEVSIISSLEILDLCGSLLGRQFEEEDIQALDALAALPSLKYLNIIQTSMWWHDVVAPRVTAIQEGYPDLEVLY